MNSELNLEFCSTCLKIGTEDDKFVKLNFTPPDEISFNDKLLFCVPEMVLEDIEECQLCKPCMAALETAYTFKCMCLKTSTKLKEFKNAQSKHSNVENRVINEGESIQNNGNTIQRNVNENLIQTVDDMLSGSGISTTCTSQSTYANQNDTNVPETNKLEQLSSEDYSPQCDDYDLNVSPLSEQCNEDEDLDSQIEIVKHELGSLLTESLAHIPDLNTNQTVKINKKQNLSKDFSPKIQKSVKVSKLNNSTIKLVKKSASRNNQTNFNHKKQAVSISEKQSKPQESDNTKIIETAFKNIPALRNCSPKSFQCQVILEKLNQSKLPIRSNKMKPIFSCFVCDMDIKRKERFISHLLRHLNTEPFKCNKCSKKFYRRDSLIQHHRIGHNVRKHRDDADIGHMRKIAEELVSNFLKTKGHSLEDLKKHTKLVNNKKLEIPKKDTKPRNVIEKKKSKMLKRITLTDNIYLCKLCSFYTYHRSKYNVHMLRHHNGTVSFQCSKCSKRFLEKWRLNRHQREVNCNIKNNVSTPVKIQEFICNVCQKKFTNQKEYLEHEQTHTNSQPNNVIQLESSVFVKLKKSRKRYYCEICNLEYASKDHQYVHTGEKPYKCKICERQFGAQTTLRKHYFVHTKRKEVLNGEKKKKKTKKQKMKVILKDFCQEQIINENDLCVTPNVIENLSQACNNLGNAETEHTVFMCESTV